MKIKDLKRIIKEELVAILAENAPAKEPGTKEAPTKPDTDEKAKPRRGFEPKPGAEPKPKAKKASLKEEDMVKKIADRFKKLKK
jgi:hypothetical protein